MMWAGLLRQMGPCVGPMIFTSVLPSFWMAFYTIGEYLPTMFEK
jgi:hypothetical protein